MSSHDRRQHSGASVSNRQFGFAFALAAVLGIAAACQSSPEAPFTSLRANSVTAEHNHIDSDKLTSEQHAAIARVKNATARFHDFEESQKAGYTSQYPAGCKTSPEGGQGFHYLNPALVDDKIELLKPELVMYEPQKNGKLQLVGVDYVVPFTAWKSDSAPTLLGVPFMRNEPLGVWALHIWAWRPNPSGMFAMWNPNVNCTYAN